MNENEGKNQLNKTKLELVIQKLEGENKEQASLLVKVMEDLQQERCKSKQQLDIKAQENFKLLKEIEDLQRLVQEAKSETEKLLIRKEKSENKLVETDQYYKDTLEKQQILLFLKDLTHDFVKFQKMIAYKHFLILFHPLAG